MVRPLTAAMPHVDLAVRIAVNGRSEVQSPSVCESSNVHRPAFALGKHDAE